MPVTHNSPGRGGRGGGRGRGRGRGYSFQKTNRLLNKHGKAYREQDLKPGSKCKPSQQTPEHPTTSTVSTTPIEETKDAYLDLVQSMKKKPRFYFEQLLHQLKEDGSSSEEDVPSSDSENTPAPAADVDSAETDSEVSVDDQSADEDTVQEDIKVDIDYFTHNYSSQSVLQTTPKPPYQTLPNTLYNIQTTNPGSTPNIKTTDDLLKLGIEPVLVKSWVKNTKQVESKGVMKPISSTLCPLLQQGSDILFTDSTFENQPEILKLLALHSLNHVFKTRKIILKNNARLARAAQAEKELDADDVRDQGFTRPKVLVLLPFRNVAHRFVQQLLKVALPGDKKQISNRKRFEEDYGSETKEKPNLSKSGKSGKSLSYQKLFLGNNDDFFTLGLAVAKNSVKLYTDFYNSDIILSSPVALRSIIGAEGDKERDYDFLSSVEVVSLVMADVFLMQNWEHLTHIYQHLNLNPVTDHGTDFSRVKMWALDGHGKQYRQNILLTSYTCPEINALFNKECVSGRGAARVTVQEQSGALGSVLYPVRQVFIRMKDKKVDETHCDYITNVRYEYFVHSILPQYQAGDMCSLVVVIPSYFDFVRIRNNFKKEGRNFAQLHEYSSNKAITNVRRSFAEGTVKYLLTTERFFFFKRYKLKNVKHVVFYEPPLNSECYVHYVNMMHEETSTSTLIYNKFDGTKLERILGTKQCLHLISSAQSTHMIISE